jgi:hypothetical protein
MVMNSDRSYTFRDGGLADARFADEHGVVLGAARQDLDGAPDLVVSANYRVKFAVARGRRQITRVLGQRLVLALRVLNRQGRHFNNLIWHALIGMSCKQAFRALAIRNQAIIAIKHAWINTSIQKGVTEPCYAK